MTEEDPPSLPHAFERVECWRAVWRETGSLVLLLDFDGTLAPIVSRPEAAALPAETRQHLERLRSRVGVEVAVVSGRGLSDAREKMGIPDIDYAGNHGMEIEGPRLRRIHPGAAAARPTLERVRERVAVAVRETAGAFVEDKGLTLSVHYRLVSPEEVPGVRRAVEEATEGEDAVRVTSGKMVMEIRPRVDWHKGRAVDFLLDSIDPPQGAPVLYLGDDTTDEDAFRAVAARKTVRGEGVRVGRPEGGRTAARSYVENPLEVAELLGRLGTPG
jgi:trehalose 6-phosphate phosphatase